MLHLKQQAVEALSLLPQAPAELGQAIQSIASPSALADVVASYMDLKPDEKQEVLETIDIERRLDKVLSLLNQRIEVLRMSKKISDQTKESKIGSASGRESVGQYVYIAGVAGSIKKNKRSRHE